MGADNWTRCPKCSNDYVTKLHELDTKLTQSYGKISQEAYRELAVETDRAREVAMDKYVENFREDWEIGVYGGKFQVGYTGSCADCGFTHRFDHEEQL